LRLAEVQPPKTTGTWSWSISFLDFSAKVGQSEAPSSTMYSILYFLPSTSTPPAALISSIAIFSVSTRVDSEMAMVPVSECRMPTVTLSS
jgi:hypothetical protein